MNKAPEVDDWVKYLYLPKYKYRLIKDDNEPRIDKTIIEFEDPIREVSGNHIFVDWIDWDGDIGIKKIKRFNKCDFQPPSWVLEDAWKIVEVVEDTKESWTSNKNPDDPSAVISDIRYVILNITAKHSTGITWKFFITDPHRYSNGVRIEDLTKII